MAYARFWLVPTVRALVGLAASCLVAGVVRGADEPRADAWVSRDAVIYLEVPRPAALIARITDPKLRAMLAAIPGYQERLDKALENDETKRLLTQVKAFETAMGMAWTGAMSGLAGKGIVA